MSLLTRYMLSIGVRNYKNIFQENRFFQQPLKNNYLKQLHHNQRFCSSEASNEIKKPSLFQKFKTMYKDYWYVLVPVHVVTSSAWILSFYELAKSGVNLKYYMEWLGFSENIVSKVTESGAGNLAIAYALYKIATPARYAVTLGGTTLAINRLKMMGYIKPAKEIYQANKDKIMTAAKKKMN